MFERWRRCKLKIREDGPMTMIGELIGFVKREKPINTPYLNDSRFDQTYSVDALVVLLDFDRGKILQIPPYWLKIIDEDE